MATELPELPLEAWIDTYATLHRYTQIVGKVKLALAPMVNQWWQVALQLSPSGLTTGLVPWRDEAFAVDFDFLAHELTVRTSRGDRQVMELEPRAVAEFYADFLAALATVGIDVQIWDVPVEIPADTTRFSRDRHHAAYDREQVRRWWRVMLAAAVVFQRFRGGFTGKCSPVHFFWGSFDLAVSRYSGRAAPPRPGADRVTQEAYRDEVSSVGFWPGSPGVSDAAFYSYVAPEPEGFARAEVRPAAARYEPKLREFLLPYEDVRRAASPRDALLAFCQSAYEAAANRAGWDRGTLERPPLALPRARGGTLQAEQPTAD